MKNKIVLGIISGVALIVLLIIAYKLTNSPQQASYPEVNKILPTDHVKWSPEKKNILVEYSDFECPACKVFHDMIRQQIETPQSGQVDVTKKITFIYRNFPLDQHQNAQSAAQAAEAAGKQDKFFQFIDLVFDRQNDWGEKSDPTPYYLQYAKDLKLNVDQFKKDMSSKEVKDKVAADVLSGEKAAIDATPTFYLNGERLDNIQSFADFKQLLIDAANK